MPSLLSFAETTIPNTDEMRVLGAGTEAPNLCLFIPPKNSGEYTTVWGICYVYPDLFSSHPPAGPAAAPAFARGYGGQAKLPRTASRTIEYDCRVAGRGISIGSDYPPPSPARPAVTRSWS